MFVFFLIRCETDLLGALSLACDALSFLSAERDAKGRGTLLLVGIAFVTVPFAELAFASLGDAFAEADALEAFAKLTLVCGAVVIGLLRGVLAGVVVGFAILDADTNNPVVTDGAVCVAVFPGGPFA